MDPARLPPGAVRRAFALPLALLAVFVARALSGAHGPLAGVVVHWAGAAITLCAAAICAWRAIALASERAAWACMAAGLACAGLGNVVLALFYAGVTPPLPSAADVCWIGFYPFAYVGLVLLARPHAKRGGAGLWLDGLIGALACGALGAQL
ncbi:MAG TPA: hypothetical protein VFV85_03405, partial [Conexibacter sp.]|nr:hypothetical protein [Conexibacter sp.]